MNPFDYLLIALGAIFAAITIACTGVVLLTLP